MAVVLETNVVLTARVARHPFHAIVQSLAAGRLTIAASTTILLEYEEIVTARASAAQCLRCGNIPPDLFERRGYVVRCKDWDAHERFEQKRRAWQERKKNDVQS